MNKHEHDELNKQLAAELTEMEIQEQMKGTRGNRESAIEMATIELSIKRSLNRIKAARERNIKTFKEVIATRDKLIARGYSRTGPDVKKADEAIKMLSAMLKEDGIDPDLLR